MTATKADAYVPADCARPWVNLALSTRGLILSLKGRLQRRTKVTEVAVGSSAVERVGLEQ